MGIPNHWFRSYLSDRKQCVKIGDKVSSFLDVTCGVPQGSILGPTLFLCYINDLSVALKCHLALYADDSALMASGPNSGEVSDFLTAQMSKCKTWLVDNRLSLHVGKTECILFGSSRKLKGRDFIVKCGDVVINRVMSVKYLGVNLDQHLNFREHVEGLVKKATSKLFFLYRNGANLDRGSRKLLCSALVNSGVEYCISAWYPGLLEESKNRLATLQRKMVRFVVGMGAREHVAEGDIFSLGWLPIWRRAEYFMTMHAARVKMSISPGYIAQNFVLASDAHSYGLRQHEYNFSISSCHFPVCSFTRTAIKLWNSLPSELKQIGNIAVFRRRLKAFMKIG